MYLTVTTLLRIPCNVKLAGPQDQNYVIMLKGLDHKYIR